VRFNVDENNNFVSAVTKNGVEIRADFCVLGTGARPNVEIARQAGFKSIATFKDRKISEFAIV
jgi:NADPH-dependent 2,4-dienoyl-CoA reductase/sulfur reductase-like enzyme